MTIVRIASQCLGRRPTFQLMTGPRRINLHGQQNSLAKPSFTQQFSLTSKLSSKQPRQDTTKKDAPNTPPELPAFNLDSLGLSPRIKMFLIVLLCIFGTIETFTWTIFLYNRFYKKDKTNEELDGDDSTT